MTASNVFAHLAKDQHQAVMLEVDGVQVGRVTGFEAKSDVAHHDVKTLRGNGSVKELLRTHGATTAVIQHLLVDYMALELTLLAQIMGATWVKASPRSARTWFKRLSIRGGCFVAVGLPSLKYGEDDFFRAVQGDVRDALASASLPLVPFLPDEHAVDLVLYVDGGASRSLRLRIAKTLARLSLGIGPHRALAPMIWVSQRRPDMSVVRRLRTLPQEDGTSCEST